MPTLANPSTELAPILGLDDEFPDNVWVLKAGLKFVCYKHGNLHGLAVFSTASLAAAFNVAHGVSYAVGEEVTFDRAREIAKSRPSHVTCVMLLDNINDPVIHYVR
jgi:hypothetical protein